MSIINFNKRSIFILCIFGFIVLGLGSCSGGQENNHDKSEKPKGEKESHTPADDLYFFSKSKGTFEKNIVEGFVENESKDATYSNILVKVEFYDEDGAVIMSKELKFDKSVEPQQMQKIKLEVDFPEEIKKYRIKLISADVLPFEKSINDIGL